VLAPAGWPRSSRRSRPTGERPPPWDGGDSEPFGGIHHQVKMGNGRQQSKQCPPKSGVLQDAAFRSEPPPSLAPVPPLRHVTTLSTPLGACTWMRMWGGISSTQGGIVHCPKSKGYPSCGRSQGGFRRTIKLIFFQNTRAQNPHEVWLGSQE